MENKPLQVDVLFKSYENKNETKHTIEGCYATCFLDEDLRHYYAGKKIRMMLNDGNEFLGVIREIRFFPSISNNALVLEIYI